LVSEHAERRREIEAGESTVVGLNHYTEAEPSPLVADLDELAFEKIDPGLEAEQIERLDAWRKQRDDAAVTKALDLLRTTAAGDDGLVPASIEAARSGVTTGEWADALREVFGEYRAPTGMGARVTGARAKSFEVLRGKVSAAAHRAGAARLRMLVAKPGLDGHSNAAEQVALRARDAGFEVVYQGIRLTPGQIARAAADEDVHVIGLSILSGAHNLLVPEVIEKLKQEGVDPARVPVIVGGVIPEEDEAKLQELGVARVYTPKDFDLDRMMGEIADLIGNHSSS
jgi:(2R)-ethylmalonyl-CoA mutase